MFNVFKTAEQREKTAKNCAHFWVKRTRDYEVGEYTTIWEDEPSWFCRKCGGWEEDLIKNGMITNK